jgi:hypothetical protein
MFYTFIAQSQLVGLSIGLFIYTVKLTIANPTSAFFNAGPSLVPSPVTATTSRLDVSLLSMIPFTRTYLSCGDDRASTRRFGHTWSNNFWETYSKIKVRSQISG